MWHAITVATTKRLPHLWQKSVVKWMPSRHALRPQLTLPLDCDLAPSSFDFGIHCTHLHGMPPHFSAMTLQAPSMGCNRLRFYLHGMLVVGSEQRIMRLLGVVGLSNLFICSLSDTWTQFVVVELYCAQLIL